MKMAAGFLLAIGCLWGLLVVWMFLSVAGAAGTPESWPKTALYWSGMFVGPLMLVVGTVLLLRGASLRSGAVLAELGCIILTGFALYNSIIGLQRKPLQAPPPYLFYAALLLIMIVSDVAAYKIYKAIGDFDDPIPDPGNCDAVAGSNARAADHGTKESR